MGGDPRVPGWAIAARVVALAAAACMAVPAANLLAPAVALAAAACMAVPAANLLAPALIKTPADLGGLCRVTVARCMPVLGLRGPR